MSYQDRIKLMNNIQKEMETVVATDSNSDITKSNNKDVVESTVPEVYNVMTAEGLINQLNRLYNKGGINKEYYLQQVELMKNTYPSMYGLIKEKLLMN